MVLTNIPVMKKIMYILIISVLALSHLQAQKLTGTIIGTSDNFDYTTYSCSRAVNTPPNVFDGNLNTFLAGCNRSYVWAGLDLGEPHVITEIAYCPRVEMQERLVLGVFEGANNPDFGDAIPIFVITQKPADKTLTRQAISCSRAFRYVRYVGPDNSRGNIAEVEFYGFKSSGDDSKLYQTTNLPSVIIHTADAQDVVVKELYIKGIVSVVSENGTEIYTDSLEIKGRGNASWDFPKKPYRLKLNNKAKLLGMPAREKNWTLISNYGDKTLMRNLLAFDLSQRLEMPYTPAGKPVDVFLNGEYKGTYQLCDQVEVASARVPVEKIPAATNALPDLSGGYLLEMDAYAYNEISWFESGRNRIPVTIKYPKDDEIISAQRNYIVNHFNQMEASVYSSSYTSPTAGFRKYLDTETFLRHFLIGEMSGNTDTYWSVYMYKFRNTIGDPSKDKFYFGPVWDYDIAYENDSRTYPINQNQSWIYNSTGSTANGVHDWVNRLFSDPLMMTDLKKIYAGYRDRNVVSADVLKSVVDRYADEINQSQQLNFTRWNILNQRVHMNFRALGSYRAEVEAMKTFISERVTWMDKKLNYIPNAVSTTISPSICYWTNDKTLYINGFEDNSFVRVFDASGRNITQKSANNEFSIQLNPGIYVVRIIENSSRESIFKCVIR